MRRRTLIAGAVSAALLAGCAATSRPHDPSVDPADFGGKKLLWPVRGMVTFVNFGSPDIAFCVGQSETSEYLREQYAGRIAVIDVDIRDYPGCVEYYRMENIPYQRFYDFEGRTAFAHSGICSAAELSEFIDVLLEHEERVKRERGELP